MRAGSLAVEWEANFLLFKGLGTRVRDMSVTIRAGGGGSSCHDARRGPGGVPFGSFASGSWE